MKLNLSNNPLYILKLKRLIGFFLYFLYTSLDKLLKFHGFWERASKEIALATRGPHHEIGSLTALEA